MKGKRKGESIGSGHDEESEAWIFNDDVRTTDRMKEEGRSGVPPGDGVSTEVDQGGSSVRARRAPMRSEENEEGAERDRDEGSEEKYEIPDTVTSDVKDTVADGEERESEGVRETITSAAAAAWVAVTVGQMVIQRQQWCWRRMCWEQRSRREEAKSMRMCGTAIRDNPRTIMSGGDIRCGGERL
jgi:hypothetical protein